MKNLLPLIVLFPFVFFNCSSSDDGDPDSVAFDANFEVTLTGDASRSLNGEAFFLHAIVSSRGDDENGSVLTVTLTNDADEDEAITLYIVTTDDTDGVNTGTYTIELEPEDENTYASLGAFIKEGNTIFLGTSGSITISRLQNDEVEGSISAVLDDQTGTTINISGEFKASGITERI